MSIYIGGNNITGGFTTEEKKYFNNSINSINEQLDNNAKENYKVSKQFLKPYMSTIPLVTIVDDDGGNRFLTEFLPLFNNKGVTCSLGIVTDFVGTSGYMNLDELKVLKESGFDILSHSKTHSANIYKNDVTSVERSTIEEDMQVSFNYLVSNGLGVPSAFVYPWGNFGDNTLKMKEVCSKIYKNAINAVGGGLNNSPNDNMYLNRLFVNMGKNNIDYYKGIIDECYINNKWLILGMHSNAPSEVNSTFLSQIIDYIQTKGIEIVNFNDALNLKGNILSAGDYNSKKNKLFIGNNGNIEGIPYALEPGYGIYNQNSLLTDFPKNKITTFIIKNGNNDSFTGEGGVITTYNFEHGSQQNYQVYISSQSQTMCIRKWDDAKATWKSPVKMLKPVIADRTILTNLTDYNIASNLENLISKNNGVVSFSLAVEHPTKTGNLATNNVIFIANGIFAPSKTIYTSAQVIYANGTIDIIPVTILFDSGSNKMRVVSQKNITTSNIRWITISGSYYTER